jgi:WD40 repeat protein
MVRLLLDYGADVTIRNQHGSNPVHLARQKAPEILNFLEQHMQIHNIDLYGVPEHLSSTQLIVNAKRSEAITVVDHAILVRWELADPPKPLRVLYTEHTHLRILASSSDGNYILMWAEGNQDNSEGILELCAWETLELVKRIPQPTEGQVQSAAFSPNGKWLALAIDSLEAVYLIDKNTGENLAEVSGGEWTASVRFAPTSELLAVACSFQGGATVGIHKHEQIWIENVFEFGRSDYTTSASQFVDTLVDVAFSPDSRFLILFETSGIYHELYPAGWRGNLALYSVENGNLQWQYSIDAAATGNVRSLAEAGYSSGFLTNVVFLNADVIACGSTAGCVLLYNTASGKLIRVHPDASVVSLALDSAGAAIWVLLSNGDLISAIYSSVGSFE